MLLFLKVTLIFLLLFIYSTLLSYKQVVFLELANKLTKRLLREIFFSLDVVNASSANTNNTS